MRIAVTGREGQVVRSLIDAALGSTDEIIAIGRPQLDLTADAGRIIGALEAVAPDLVVSAAAYTAVDRAESERDLAFSVNVSGARAVAQAAANLGVPLIHISTDYVFNGSKTSPYLETDPTGPVSVYGASKLAGEEAVLSTHPNSAVLRTAWVYSSFGTNFAKTMLRLATERDELAIVADQFGNPTSALDIANGILRVASNLVLSSDSAVRGIFHMTAQGEASWADFAEAIFAASAADGGPHAVVRHIPTAQFPTAAKRPANSRLDSSKLQSVHGVRLPNWCLSVRGVVGRILSDQKQ